MYELAVILVYGNAHPHPGMVTLTAPPHRSVAVTPAPSKFSIVTPVAIDDHSSAISIPLH